MLISTKELRTYLMGVNRKIQSDYKPTEDQTAAIIYTLSQIGKDISDWEAKQIQDNGEPPCAIGVDKEHALVVYCTSKLYEFIEGYDNEKEMTLLDFGKIWLQVKPFLKEGRFKRV